ncbi:formimidoylglutamase [Flavobacteriaceae bacterium]|nr:formimidoylglutamase [Flavobacteriaceae bacterium]
MSLEFFEPVDEAIYGVSSLLPKQVLGKRIRIHTKRLGFPELQDGVRIALFSVDENRNGFFSSTTYDINEFRRQFYQLYPGNWSLEVADLGDLPRGKTPEDSYFVIKEVCIDLRKMNIIPVIIGGSQDLTVAAYRSFENNNHWVNIVSVDNRFDFSKDEDLISGKSYMSKIIMETPSYLFNYTNIGYQSYLIAQEELDLMEKLFFESIRLGSILDDNRISEPLFREADIASFDMKCLRSSADGTYANGYPNGIDSRTICALSRYAGISDRLSLAGFFDLPNNMLFHKLLAQIIWYFIEGVNCRFGEYPVNTSHKFKRYTVPMSDREMVFFQSKISDRWWIEIKNENYLDNKSKSSTLLSCTHQDYLDACNDVLPDRWWKATKRG